MLAQLHPIPQWLRLNHTHTADSETGEPDTQDTARLVGPRDPSCNGHRISSTKPTTGGYPPFCYEPLDPDGPWTGWRQTTFPWHQRFTGIRPAPSHNSTQASVDNMVRSYCPTSNTQSQLGDLYKSDENRTIYDHLMDKDTDVTYLALSDSSHPTPAQRSKSSSPPRHVNLKQTIRASNVAIQPLPQRKLPPPPRLLTTGKGVRTRGPCLPLSSPPRRWVEFEDTFHVQQQQQQHQQQPKQPQQQQQQIRQANDLPVPNVLTDFSCTNQLLQTMPLDLASSPRRTLTLLDQSQAFSSSCDKENFHNSYITPTKSRTKKRASLLDQWNQMCEHQDAAAQTDKPVTSGNSRLKRDAQSGAKLPCSMHNHALQPKAHHSQCWTFTFYNFEDENVAQDTDALVNSVFAVLVSQLRHGNLSCRTSNRSVHQTSSKEPAFDAETLVNQSSHRHIAIRESACTAVNRNCTTLRSPQGLDLCVRWATSSNSVNNQTHNLEDPLRKTYICATLSGPHSAGLCGHRLPHPSSPTKRRRGHRTQFRALRKPDRTGGHNTRSCCVCQAALWAFQRRILTQHDFSTTSLNDASVACHSSSSSFKLEEAPNRDRLRLRRRHSHCDAQASRSTSFHWLKRRQVVSGDFQGERHLTIPTEVCVAEDDVRNSPRLKFAPFFCYAPKTCAVNQTLLAENGTCPWACQDTSARECLPTSKRITAGSSVKHCRTQSQPQTAQERQRSFGDPHAKTSLNCSHCRCAKPCHWSVQQSSPLELTHAAHLKSRDLIAKESMLNTPGQENQHRLNEFVTRQRNLITDRKTRHRYRRSLGQQHVKEWLGVPVTSR